MGLLLGGVIFNFLVQDLGGLDDLIAVAVGEFDDVEDVTDAILLFLRVGELVPLDASGIAHVLH